MNKNHPQNIENKVPVEVSSEKLETERNSVLRQIWKTLDETGDNVVKLEKKNATAKEKQELAELKDIAEKTGYLRVKENKNRFKVKVDLKKYDRSKDLDRMYKDLAKTSANDYLKNVHDELRQRRIGMHYLHLLPEDMA